MATKTITLTLSDERARIAPGSLRAAALLLSNMAAASVAHLNPAERATMIAAAKADIALFEELARQIEPDDAMAASSRQAYAGLKRKAG